MLLHFSVDNSVMVRVSINHKSFEVIQNKTKPCQVFADFLC